MSSAVRVVLSITVIFLPVFSWSLILEEASSLKRLLSPCFATRLHESAVGGGDAESPKAQFVSANKDDGLSDRFQYKVNALQRNYDPLVGADDENQVGNILNAMLRFPTNYTFTVVGKTRGQEDLVQSYVEQIKQVVISISGNPSSVICEATPRGNSFTRLSIQVMVDSPAVVNSIYDAIDGVEMTVMKY